MKVATTTPFWPSPVSFSTSSNESDVLSQQHSLMLEPDDVIIQNDSPSYSADDSSERVGIQIVSTFLEDKGIDINPQNLKTLVSLKLFNKKLDHLPSEIHLLTKLHELNLKLNNLTDLPDSLVELKSLKVINLEGNNFVKFPEVLKKMVQLKAIYLDRNPLTEIPASLEGIIQSVPSWAMWVEE